MGGITRTLTELHDSSIATGASLEDWGDALEDDVYHVIFVTPLLTKDLALDCWSANEVATRLLPELGRNQAPIVDVPGDGIGLSLLVRSGRCFGKCQLTLLAEGDDLLGNRAGSLSLGHGSDNAIVLDEAAHQIREHRVSVVALASQFVRPLEMAHG